MKIQSKKDTQLIENEKKVLEKVDQHPFIMKYYGFMQDSKNSYFITELIKGEDLFSYHRYVGNFNPKQTEFYGS